VRGTTNVGTLAERSVVVCRIQWPTCTCLAGTWEPVPVISGTLTLPA